VEASRRFFLLRQPGTDNAHFAYDQRMQPSADPAPKMDAQKTYVFWLNRNTE
jgi:hypothetical protein